MKIIRNKTKLLKVIKNVKNLGFVPTMGSLHKGHVSLIKKSISQCHKTIVSIFINKPQFNRKSDYIKYPKNLKKDIFILKSSKVDFLYLPTVNQIYPNGINKKINIHPFKKDLCGKFRPGHFEAVTDVIDRFIKIINPSKIFFGEKDMQQLKIIEDYLIKNKINTKVIGCKIIREKNGIAYSSRNLLLSLREKKIAAQIYMLLLKKKKKLINRKISFNSIKEKIHILGVKKIEYLKIININKIIRPYKKNIKNKIFISYYLGSTRLIDNI